MGFLNLDALKKWLLSLKRGLRRRLDFWSWGSQRWVSWSRSRSGRSRRVSRHRLCTLQTYSSRTGRPKCQGLYSRSHRWRDLQMWSSPQISTQCRRPRSTQRLCWRWYQGCSPGLTSLSRGSWWEFWVHRPQLYSELWFGGLGNCWEWRRGWMTPTFCRSPS